MIAQNSIPKKIRWNFISHYIEIKLLPEFDIKILYKKEDMIGKIKYSTSGNSLIGTRRIKEILKQVLFFYKEFQILKFKLL